MIKSFFVELIYRFIWPAIANWVERSEKKRTRDAQAENDARDRGPSDAVRDRMRIRAGADGQRDARGNLPPSDDRGGTDKGS